MWGYVLKTSEKNKIDLEKEGLLVKS